MNPHRIGRIGRLAAAGTLVFTAATAPWSVVLAQPATTAATAVSAEFTSVAPSSVDRYREHNLTLANPYFEGRRPGTAGNERAAEYIEFWFRKFGLIPLFPVTTALEADGPEIVQKNASYRQAFPYRSLPQATEQTVRLESKDGRVIEFAPGKDFEVLGITGTGEAAGELVFAGYGIEEGPEGFTSFPAGERRLDGKIAVVLRFEPVNETGRSAFGSGRGTSAGWSNAAAIEPKFRALAQRGAAGIILVSPPGAADERIHRLETTAGTATLGRRQNIPVVMLSMDAADRLVRSADAQGRSLLDLRRLADKGAQGFVELTGATVQLSTAVERVPQLTDNVAGVLRGRGRLADEYVIIGAHFDHVGDGTLGGSRSNEVGVIHYGADDNASGTAGMLLCAELLTELYKGLPDDAEARSIIFMGFSAEELGLIGSRYFVQNSPIPAAATYAMLNLDMIGRMRENRMEVSGVGTAEGFLELLEPMFEATGLTVNKSRSGRGPSDHASFYAAGVPVLHLFTGLHAEYHTPRDVSSLINFDGGAQIATLTSRIAHTLATRPEPLVFTSTDGPSRTGKNEAQAAPAPAPAHGAGDPPAAAGPTAGSTMRGVRVRFGISPGTYDESEPGVLVGEVFPDTSASEAGIKAGDKLVKWNGKEVDGVEGWMTFLAAANPGDEVDIVVMRAGKPVELKVKLKARDSGAR